MATVSLTDPVVSGSEGTWGATLNANHTLIENAFNGATAIEPNLALGAFQIGGVAVTSTAAEVNLLDGVTWTLTGLNGLTATVTELNYTDGVTSAIQTQLDNKQALDATLTALAGLSTGANKVPYSTGTDAFSQLDFLDEDDLSSDSATALPSQQSVKAYVDGNAIGLGQTWSDVDGVGNRTIDNATPMQAGSRPVQLLITIAASGTAELKMGATASTVRVAQVSAASGTVQTFPAVIVPAGWYYQVATVSGSPSIDEWWELS